MRIVSDDSVFIISGIMSVDILADEMANIYNVQSTSFTGEKMQRVNGNYHETIQKKIVGHIRRSLT